MNYKQEPRICRDCGSVYNPDKHGYNICKRCKKRRWPPSEEARKRKNRKKTIARALKERPYLVHRKDKCEECGFIPTVISQLAVDHIDGNHKNNEITNLQTLCHNCHALKSHINKDWMVANGHKGNNAQFSLDFTSTQTDIHIEVSCQHLSQPKFAVSYQQSLFQ